VRGSHQVIQRDSNLAGLIQPTNEHAVQCRGSVPIDEAYPIGTNGAFAYETRRDVS